MSASVITVASLTLFTSPVGDYREDVYLTALRNFTYEAEPPGTDKHVMFLHHERKFKGDCEDFAFTLLVGMGEFNGRVWRVTRGGPVDHAVYVLDGYVYDNLHKRPVRVDDYGWTFVEQLKFNGEIVNNAQ